MTRLITTLRSIWKTLPAAVGHYSEGAYGFMPEVRYERR